MTAVTLVPDPPVLAGVGKSLWLSARGGRYSVVGLHRQPRGLLVGSRIVDAVFCGDPTLRSQHVLGVGVWCKLSAY